MKRSELKSLIKECIVEIKQLKKKLHLYSVKIPLDLNKQKLYTIVGKKAYEIIRKDVGGTPGLLFFTYNTDIKTFNYYFSKKDYLHIWAMLCDYALDLLIDNIDDLNNFIDEN